MIRIIVTAFGILFSYLLQSSVFSHFELAGVVPDIVIIFVITTGYLQGKTYGMFFGLFSGLLMDFCIGSYIGYFAIMYMLIGYMSGFGNKIYDKDDYTLPIIFIGTGELLYQHMYYFFSFALRGRLDYLFYLKRLMLPRTIYTLAAGIFFYKLFHTFHRILLKLEHKNES